MPKSDTLRRIANHFMILDSPPLNQTILYCKGLIFGRTLHMKIEGSCVTFEPCDAAFVKKFGPLEAANMVLDYHSVHPDMPFLYDAEQLAGFFGISCGELNHIVNRIQKEYKKAFLPKKMALIAAYTYQVSDFNFVWAQSRIEFFHSSLFQNLQLLIKKEALLAKMQSHTLGRRTF